jgi:hypothetical protein
VRPLFVPTPTAGTPARGRSAARRRSPDRARHSPALPRARLPRTRLSARHPAQTVPRLRQLLRHRSGVACSWNTCSSIKIRRNHRGVSIFVTVRDVQGPATYCRDPAVRVFLHSVRVQLPQHRIHHRILDPTPVDASLGGLLLSVVGSPFGETVAQRGAGGQENVRDLSGLGPPEVRILLPAIRPRNELSANP